MLGISEKNAPLKTTKNMMLLCFTECLRTWNLTDSVIWKVNQLTEPLANSEGALGRVHGIIVENSWVMSS